MIATHYTNFRSIGTTLNNLTRDCSAPIFSSDDSADPSTYNNNEWARNIYTQDGSTIYSIVHNEYTPDDEFDSWYNTLTLATSIDTGRTYTQLNSPDHFIAGIPYQFEAGPPMGIFGGSSPIFNPADGYYYMMVHLEAYGLQDWGAGVIRTQDIGDPNSWRGWDGTGYNVVFKDPYHEAITDPADHILAPVSRDRIGKMSGYLAYSTYFEKYMVVDYGQFYDPESGEGKYGFFYSLSDDFIHWSFPVLMMESTIDSWWDVGGIFYPSIVDESDTSRNFNHPGQTAYLYYTKWNTGTYDRDLVRVPIQFNKNEVSTFTVNSTGDFHSLNPYTGSASTGNTISNGDAEVTLRSAIETVLTSPDTTFQYTINFNIPGEGPHVISPGSSFPTITNSIIIDGFSQTGSSPNSNNFSDGNNATIKIAMDGSATADAAAFILLDKATTIKGLAIYGFGNAITDGNSVLINGHLTSTPTTDFRIEIFNNASCDASGAGEGESMVGFFNVTTNENGFAEFSETLSGVVPSGNVITATATGEDNSTSMFSDCSYAFTESEAPTLTLSLTEASFQFPSFIQPVTSSDFTITNTGDYELSWESSSDASWLSAGPDYGTTSPGAVTEVGLNVDLSELPTGTYEGTLTITSNALNNPTQTIDVMVFYGTGGPSNITHTPDTVFVNVSEGPDTTVSFYLHNIGDESVTWTAGFTGINWVNSVTPNSGTTAVNDSTQIQFNVRPGNLQPGENIGSVWVSLNPELTEVMEVPVVATLLVPAISVSSDTIDVSLSYVVPDPSLSFMIYNMGEADLIWEIDDFIGGNWTYGYSPSSGTLSADDAVEITFNIQIFSLQEGVNSGIIPVGSNDPENQTTQIVLNVDYSSGVDPDPVLTINTPEDGATLTNSNLGIGFSVEHFTIGAEGDSIDGHLHYSLDNGDAQMHYDSSPIQLADLSLGNHTFILWLVDTGHNTLEPHVADTISFTIEAPDEIYNPYDDITYDHVIIESFSPDDINGSNNFMNRIPDDAILVYQTNEGRYGKLQIVDYGETLTIAFETYDENGDIFASSESLTVNGNASVDLDEGVITTDDQVRDFWWEIQGAINRWFRVENGAEFGFYGFWKITKQMVQSSTLSNETLNAIEDGENDLVDGAIILYRTNQNRYGKFQVEEYGPSLRIKWWTFTMEGFIHSRGDSLIIGANQSCDLELGQQVPNNSGHRDFYWQQAAEGERYLIPKNAAHFGVYAPNHAPYANDQSVTTLENTEVEIVLDVGDIDGDNLMININQWPQSGTLDGTPPVLSYMPYPDFVGNDQFVYTVSDGALSNSATVTIVVTEGGGGNSAPEIEDMADIQINEDELNGVTFEINATDPDNDPISFTLASNNEAVGWVNEGQTNKSLMFSLTAPEHWNGSTVFTAIASDESLSDTIYFNVNIIPVNDPPIALDLFVETDEDVPVVFEFVGDDIEGDNLTFQVIDGPEHGTFDGQYIPNQDYFGDDNFTYVAHDGENNSSPANVSITIHPVNDAPGLFSLISPLNNETIALTSEMLNDTLWFQWSQSTDIDSDEIFYEFDGNSSLGMLEGHFNLGSDTSAWILYSDILDIADTSSIIEDEWIVIATDNEDTTLAENGPFSLTIDMSELSIDNTMMPKSFVLHQNFPNPFNPTTRISYELPEDSYVQLMVYDISGREIQSLVSGFEPAGYKEIVWDATSQTGSPVGTGLYFLRIHAGDFVDTKKMLLLK